MRRRTILATGVSTLALGLLPMVGHAGPARDRDETRLLAKLIASARHAAGLGAPVVLPELAETARRQVRRMQFLGHATHIDAAGRDPAERARHAGYSGRVLGEALAETRGDVRETLRCWLDDDDTRAVLLDPDACEIGISGLVDATGIVRWDVLTGTGGAARDLPAPKRRRTLRQT